jgi:hypothetical protein
MPESPYANDELPEGDGVLEPDESLETDDLSQDPLDTGLAVPDRWSPAEQFGSTRSDERAGESLDRRLAEEEPDTGAGGRQDPDAPWPVGSAPEPRTGRLVAGDEGGGPTSWPVTSDSTRMRPAPSRRRYTWSPRRGRTRRGSLRPFSRRAPVLR